MLGHDIQAVLQFWRAKSGISVPPRAGERASKYLFSNDVIRI